MTPKNSSLPKRNKNLFPIGEEEMDKLTEEELEGNRLLFVAEFTNGEEQFLRFRRE
jgi:hypothetical protein